MLKLNHLRSLIPKTKIYQPLPFTPKTIFPFSSEPPKEQPMTFIQKWFGPQNVKASPTFNKRWLMVVPAFMTHFCIGSPWAWSLIAGVLIRENGFTVSSSLDWTLGQATLPLSLIFFFQGLSAAMIGNWQIKAGARASMTVAGLFFGGGMIVGSIGVATHQLWLLYLGYGVLSGCGVGIAYTPPLQALIEWFPDRRGLASGLTIGGFGSGAIAFAPISQYLIKNFERLPEFAGALGSIQTITQNGRLFVDNNGLLREVVLANAADLAKIGGQNLLEGFYYVGTGATGVAPTLAIMGLMYSSIMIASAFAIRRPLPGYKPAGWEPKPVAGTTTALVGNVHVNRVMYTPQYWLLAGTFCCLATGGIAVFSVAKPMMLDVFGSNLPKLVTASFASGFVLMLSAANLFGRILWALLSDKIGRRKTFFLFTAGSVPLYMLLPTLVSSVVTTGSIISLYGFIACTVVSISIMGGCYAIIPAYEADLFGSKYVGPIHGRFLLASSVAALSGPSILLNLRNRAEVTAIQDLLAKCDAEKFRNLFGVDISQADTLIQAKTLTINKLMKLVPEGTVNPTPFLYDSTMYTMAALMTLAAASHYLVKPVNKKYFEVIEQKSEEKK